MMLIRTVVRPSSIHGMGLFALERIPKGTEIWRFEPGFDRTFARRPSKAAPTGSGSHPLVCPIVPTRMVNGSSVGITPAS